MSSYITLDLNYDRDGRKWRVSFQTKPEPKVILSGDTPTRDELLEVLMTPGVNTQPLIVVQIIESAIGSAERTK